MSFEEALVRIVGIAVLSFYCLKTLIISGIRAMKEIRLEIRQSVKEIKQKSMRDELELQIEGLEKK